jgi:hypothetical protein
VVPAHSILRRLGALALAALLLTGALPVDAYAAMIGVAEQCPHHGRACNCPKACKREETAPAPEEKANLPACHRKAAQEKPQCTMSACGKVELPSFVVTGHDPYVGFTPTPAFFQDAWEKAFMEAIQVPPSKAYAPINPPPRLLLMHLG